MDEPTPTADALAASDVTPPAGDTSTPPVAAPAAATPPTDAPVSLTPAELQAKIDEAATKASRDANREAANLRAKLKEHEDAKLSDAERAEQAAAAATERAEAAEKAVRDARLEAAVTLAATTAKVDPAIALKLIDGVSFDDDGKPEGVADAITRLTAAHPELVQHTAPGGTATNPQRGSGETPKSDTEKLSDLRARASSTGPAWGGGGLRTFN
jgi:hypothetical protein